MRIEIECPGKQMTDEGGFLIVSDCEVRADIEIRHHLKPDRTEMPVDVIATDIRIADSEGIVWLATSFITAETFVRHMFDLSETHLMYLFRLDSPTANSPLPYEGSPSFNHAIESASFLRDVHCCLDDRFHRAFLFGPKEKPCVVEVPFHYSEMVFDIAGLFSNFLGAPELSGLAVRVNHLHDEGLVDSNQEPVGSFGFFMHPRYLLMNTAVFGQPNRNPSECDLPAPLVFQRTADVGEPQSHVRFEPFVTN